MEFEREFAVRRGREALVAVLRDDKSLTSLMPDTEIVERRGKERRTLTRAHVMGQSQEIRFVFEERDDGNLGFHKICDGKVWSSLEGAVELHPVTDALTRVRIHMEGSTRAMVPEFTIRTPMRDQIDDMARALRARMEEA